MKKFVALAVFCLLAFVAQSQFVIKGKVVDKKTSDPLQGVTITLSHPIKKVTATDLSGSFQFEVASPGLCKISAAHVGMKTETKSLQVSTAVTPVDFELEEIAFMLEPLELKSIRVSDRAPFTKTNISKSEINKNNLGQDLPFLLNQTPSVVVNSDAGNGVGYTGIRIRGSDASRINVTMNGIPYNDAESQGTFFVDLPDIASSINSVQVQRGVGTSSNGAGAFGATINLSTNEFVDSAYAEINNAFGSFNTWKHTVKAGTGLIGDHFTVDARLSKMSSDGFIDRASTELQSLHLSTAYTTDKSSLRFNIITGKEKTYQAWNGVPENLLNSNRTFNSAGTEKPGSPYDNETDNYQQDHYQFFVNHAFNKNVSLNTTFFLSKGRGFYEQYKADAAFADYGLAHAVFGSTNIHETDLVRQLWLDNDFYGQLVSLQHKKNKSLLTFGGGWNKYNGKHFGKIIWAEVGVPLNHKWYDVNATKADKNLYVKWQYDLSPNWQLFSDVQYRHVDYKINGFRNNPTVRVDRRFDFINPKAGISYLKNGWQAYLSYALANKEPNRDDFEAAATDQPKHETLHNIEAGLNKRKSSLSYGANVFYMGYLNQLILTGKINDVGAYTRINIPRSYRLGLELQGALNVLSWFSFSGNLSVSKNKINDGLEFIDDYDNGGQKQFEHADKTISFSPAIVGSATSTLTPLKKLEVAFLSKYVSRQFLDNTQNINRSLKPYFVQDMRVSYYIKSKWFDEINLIGQVNNVLNKKYEPNGYTFSYIYGGVVTTENFYFPMAGTNAMFGLNVKF